MDILIKRSRFNDALERPLKMYLLIWYPKAALFLRFSTFSIYSCVSTDKNRCYIVLYICFVHHAPLSLSMST